MTRKLIESLISAQEASDAGKGIYELNFNSYAKYHGYAVKDKYILDAIKEIIKSRKKDVYFYVTRDESIDSYLIYFNIRMCGKRYQMSFHSYGDFDTFLSKKGGSCKTSWDKKKPSRDVAKKLIEYLDCSKYLIR